MNEYYQTVEQNNLPAEIIPFYRRDFIDDIYVPADACISEVFNKKPENKLKLVKNEYNSTDDHNK